MSTHVSTERMNDLVDGLLEAREVARVEEHLQECGACRDTYARISETVSELRALPRAAETPEAVWSGVQARIAGRAPGEGREDEGVLLTFPGGSATERRRAFSTAHLAAAAGLAAVLSAGVTWSVLSSPAASAPASGPSAVQVGSPLGPAARAVSPASGAYESAVRDLEAVLAAGRGVLAPETLVTIDASLRQIDEALAEVGSALASDPSSEILGRLLANHPRAKRRVLRQAATAVMAST